VDGIHSCRPQRPESAGQTPRRHESGGWTLWALAGAGKEDVVSPGDWFTVNATETRAALVEGAAGLVAGNRVLQTHESASNTNLCEGDGRGRPQG
jgi:hypothetical protein